MDEQTKACHAILTALKNDTGKRKKVDHWKKYACEALNIKKMGSSRWNLLLEHGEKLGLFYRDSNALPSKTILVVGSEKQTAILDLNIDTELLSTALDGEALDIDSAWKKSKSSPTTKKTKKSEVSKEEEEDTKTKRNSRGFLPSDYVAGTSIVKSSVTQPRNIKANVLPQGTYVPKKGDIFWVKGQDSSVKQMEVDEVHVSVYVTPLNKKDGHWTCVTPDNLYSTPKEAKATKEHPKRYWSLDAMDRDSYATFKEYEENRELFLKWKKQQEQNVEESIDDFLDNL